jgi:3-oxoacyl-[acyl-carrier-protein] synthase II
VTPAVVIAGFGIVTRHGSGVDALWRGLCSPDPIRAPAAGAAATRAAQGEVSRTALIEDATRQAMRGAGWANLDDDDLVVQVGQTETDRPGSGAEGLREWAGGLPAIGETDGCGRRMLVSHACASVGFAIAVACDWLSAGIARRALVVGGTSVASYERLGMQVVRALSPTGARPFDDSRDGTTIALGAGAIALETADAGLRRGHRTLARIAGVSCLVGGGSMAAISSDVARRCVDDALDQSGHDHVHYVHAHAGGTPLGDAAELEVIGAVAKQRAWATTPVSSHKGSVGHLLHASMFPSIGACLSALELRVAPGTSGLSRTRDLGPLAVLHEPRPLAEIDRVLINAFGFGDNNAAIVLTSPRR